MTRYATRKGDTIQFGGIDISVLDPSVPFPDAEARDENSDVLRLGVGNTSVLVAGDAEDDQEAYPLETHEDRVNATILKAGHHGSSISIGGPLLDAVKFRTVVVSNAYDARDGHPYDEALRRLAEWDVPTYWTAPHGDVVLVSDGTGCPSARNTTRRRIRSRSRRPGPMTRRHSMTLRSGCACAMTRPDRDPDPDPDVRPGRQDGRRRTSVVDINADREGPDREHLSDEYVVFESVAEKPLILSGWTLQEDVDHAYTFSDRATLALGDRITVHAGLGMNTDTDLYWDWSQAVWNNGRHTVIVTEVRGESLAVHGGDESDNTVTTTGIKSPNSVSRGKHNGQKLAVGLGSARPSDTSALAGGFVPTLEAAAGGSSGGSGIGF